MKKTLFISNSLINPSFFEGWSTTVEEAKSMGKRIILSDIEVHREQNPSGGVFFDPKNPKELAEIMWKVWTKSDIEEEKDLSRKAQEELPGRLIAFAQRYEDIVLETLGKKQKAVLS